MRTRTQPRQPAGSTQPAATEGSATARVSTAHSAQIAEYALHVNGEFAVAGRRRTASSGAGLPALWFSCSSFALSTAPPARTLIRSPTVPPGEADNEPS